MLRNAFENLATEQKQVEQYNLSSAGNVIMQEIMDWLETHPPLTNNHQVQVSNLPSEYPLPTSQIAALTPPDTYPLPSSQVADLKVNLARDPNLGTLHELQSEFLGDTLNQGDRGQITAGIIYAKDATGTPRAIRSNSQGRLFVTNDAIGNEGDTPTLEVLQVAGVKQDGTLHSLRLFSDRLLVESEDSVLRAVLSGQVYTAGGPITTNLSTSTADASLLNPVGSGKTIIIVGFLAQHDSARMLTAGFRDGGTNSGGLRAAMNHLSGGPESSGQLRIGNSTATGTTALSPEIFVRDVAPFLYQGPPIVIAPGQIKTLRITGAGVSTINYKFNVTWIEVPNV